MYNWYANDVVKSGGGWIAKDMTSLVLPSVGFIKYWNGTIWDLKPVKYWNGSSWESKPLKRWNGSSWELTS